MPIALKNRATGTDDQSMSDTVVNDSPTTATSPAAAGLFLDGNAPRLSGAPMIAAPPSGHAAPVPAPQVAPIPTPDTDDAAPDMSLPSLPTPSLPTTTPDMSAPSLPTTTPDMSAPSLPTSAPAPTHLSPDTPMSDVNALPTLPSPTPATGPASVTDNGPKTTPTGEPEHPMAHLMPSKAMPSEASRRAAEKRAIQKAKTKKIKIAVVAGMLVFTAVVGPPLGKWLVNAINEAGSTSTVEDVAD